MISVRGSRSCLRRTIIVACCMRFTGIFRITTTSFPPLNELAGIVGNGGWHRESDSPLTINLLATASKGIGLFRQIPAFARNWLDWTELKNVPDDSVVSVLVERHGAAFGGPQTPSVHLALGGIVAAASMVGTTEVRPPNRSSKLCVHTARIFLRSLLVKKQVCCFRMP